MLIFCQPARNCLILGYVVENIEINNITAEGSSIEQARQNGGLSQNLQGGGVFSKYFEM